MSDELSNYLLTIDTKKAHQELEALEEKRKAEETKIKKSMKETNEIMGKTWMKAVSIMQGTWHGLEKITSAMGMTIPSLWRTVISGAFGAVKILIPLFTAMEANPLTMIQGAFGLSQIALSIAAAIASEKDAEKAEETIADMSSFIGGISTLVGVVSF